MKKLIYLIPFLLLAWASTYLTSCKKDILFSKNYLEFSADTVLFDTIFTTVGSTTKRLKIYNTENQPVKVSSVILMGGSNSKYRINLDGVSGTKFNDIIIPAKDSLFMFVEVTLGESGVNDPFVIMDSVRFETNGKEQFVQLAAWGQDAYFYKDTFVGGMTWKNDKPHVIYNLAVVDSLQTLTIEAGTQIHFHKGAVLYVKSGRLKVEGTCADKVVFQGDRLEQFYKDVKGQYYGIYLNEALSSTIDHAIIKNGTVGVHIYSDHPNNSDYTLRITNTEIKNQASYGIFNYSGGRVYGENLNIHHNGMYAYFLLEGGDHNFRHSQFLSYGADGNHPAVAIRNYYTRSDGYTYIGNVNEGSFFNSIIYGGGESQVAFDTLTNNGAVSVNYLFNSNLIRQKNIPTDDSDFINNLWNQDPRFVGMIGSSNDEEAEEIEDKYKIASDSPCKEAGNGLYYVPSDIICMPRTNVANPDIGAYQGE